MTIQSIQSVRAAYARALALSPCSQSAIRAASQALCLPVEAVAAVVEGGAA